MTKRQIASQGFKWYIVAVIALSFIAKANASEWYVNGQKVEGKGEAIVAAARDPKALIEKKDVMEFDNKKGTFKIKKVVKD